MKRQRAEAAVHAGRRGRKSHGTGGGGGSCDAASAGCSGATTEFARTCASSVSASCGCASSISCGPCRCGCSYSDSVSPAAQVVPSELVEKVKCNFTSTPAGAEITLDGKYVGSTPSEIELVTGTHVVVFSMPGFTQWKRELTVLLGIGIDGKRNFAEG